MAVRIKLVHSSAAPPAVRAHASVSLAQGVWLSGIQVVQVERGLRVVFPTSVQMDASGGPQVQPMLEFESEQTRGKWEQRILEAYRAESAPPPPEPRPVAVGPLKHVPARESPAELPVIFVDGGCRGNPGPGAAAALICIPGRAPIELVRFLGPTNASAAEYTAVLLAMQEVERLASTGLALPELAVRGDSALLIKYFQGQWKVKDAKLFGLAAESRAVIERLHMQVHWEHVPREQNRAADTLVARCLDANLGES